MRYWKQLGLLGLALAACLWWRSGIRLSAQGTVPFQTFKFVGTVSTSPPFVETGKVWHLAFCTPAQLCAVGDFSGDGRADIAAFSRGNSGDVYVALSRGSEFGPVLLWHDSFSFGQELPIVGDFNGDGKSDLATFTRGSAGDVFVALSDGTRFVGTASKWHESFCFGDQIPAAGDFNGDGKDDLVAFTRGTTGDALVVLSTGTKFADAVVKWHDDFSFGNEVPGVGDFNADGKDDLVTFTRGNSGDVYVALSAGNRFVGTGNRWHDSFCFGEEIPAVGDFNGDAKEDIVTFKGGGKAVYVALSNGSRFEGTADQWHGNFCTGPAVPGVGDLNGDGREDVVSFEHRTLVADVYPVLAALSLSRSRSQIQPQSLGNLRCSPYDVTRPELQWRAVTATDAPVAVEGRVTRSVWNNLDDPRNHVTSHDWCALLEVDSPYVYLLGAYNVEKDNRLFEIEWESFLLNDFAKPDAGDRVWMMGRWIFDCKHGGKTEIHPPLAVAVMREEPAVLPGAGSQPLPAVQARVYVSGAGGYYNTGINGVNYTFEMELPRRPAPGAVPVWTALSPSLGDKVAPVTPEITPLPNAGNPGRLRVTIPLASRPATKPAVAAHVVAGWNHPPSAATVRKLRVILERVRILDDRDTFAAGEWFLVVGANGHWFTVPGVVGNPSGYNSVNDGAAITLNKVVDLDVHEDQELRVRVTGFECEVWCGELPPFRPLPEETDEKIGTFERVFTRASNFGIGTHSDRSSAGDYILTYRIEARG